MPTLYELAETYCQIKAELDGYADFEADVERRRLDLEKKWETMLLDAKKTHDFLGSIASLLPRLCSLYSRSGLSYANGRLYYQGNLPRGCPPFDANTYEPVLAQATDLANRTMKSALAGQFNPSGAQTLCLTFFTLQVMESFLSSPKTKQALFSAFEQEIAVTSEKVASLRESLKRAYESVKESLPEVQKEGDGLPLSKGKLLIGFRYPHLSDAAKDFLSAEFGIDPNNLPLTPLYLDLEEGGKNVLFVEGLESDEEGAFGQFAKAIFYRNLTSFNALINVASIASEDDYSRSSPLFELLKTPFDGDKKNTAAILSFPGVEGVDGLKGLKSTKMKDGVYAYNEEHPTALKAFTIVYIDNYPAATVSFRSDFARLVDNSASSGFFFIINGRYEPIEEMKEYNKISKGFSEEKGNILRLDFSDPELRFLTMDHSEEYAEQKRLFKINRKINTFLLPEVTEFFDEKDYLSPDKPYKKNDLSKGISVPVGFDDANGRPFYFSLSPKGLGNFAHIAGGTGSGKTAFVHTLILNAALKYSPDELQFYVFDFKNKKGGSADFAQYLKKKGVDNTYIPHVRYLSTKSGRNSTYDLLNLIEAKSNEYLDIISKSGKNNWADYNAYLASEGKPCLPAIYFIIDEYAEMLKAGSGGRNDRTTVLRIESLLKRIRSSGVGIIFCGQNNELGEAYSFISLPITFTRNAASFDPILEALKVQVQTLPGRHSEAMSLYNYVNGKQGYFLANTTKGAAVTINKVHSIFCGDAGSDSINLISRVIRARCGEDAYKAIQLVPGRDVNEPADSYLENPLSKRENRTASLDVGDEALIRSIYDLGVKEALYLGVNETSFYPEGIVFKRVGYLGLASTAKVDYAMKNIALSALYELRGRKGEVILAKKNKNEAYDSLVKGFPYLKNKITSLTDPSDILTKVMELEQLYQDRVNVSFQGEEKGKADPIFFVFAGADWSYLDRFIKLIKQKTVVAPKKEEKKSAPVAAPIFDDDEDIGDDALAGLFGSAANLAVLDRLPGFEESSEAEEEDDGELSLDDIGALLGGEAGAILNAPKEEKKEEAKVTEGKPFNPLDVKKAVETLISSGPSQGIYPIFFFDDPIPANDLFKHCREGNPDLIFGGPAMLESYDGGDLGNIVINEALEPVYMITFVKTGEFSTIRLYDFVSVKAFMDALR